MSSLVLTGDTSGQVTLAAPAVAGTNTITLPASTGTAILSDASSNIQFNSGYGSVATAYGCRAWVNFSGVGSTTIKGSGNVSSVTYVSTGKYTINFTNALTDANYALTLGTCGLVTSGGGKILVENSSGSGGTIGRTASAVTVLGAYSFSNPGSGVDDNSYSNSVAVFR
jgi:hypothetical protein